MTTSDPVRYPCPVCDNPLTHDHLGDEFCVHCGWDELRHEVAPRVPTAA